MADWIMKGLPLDDPLRIRTAAELANWVEEIGFLPFFAGEVPGFSAEEHVASEYWWTGEKALDPWEWREIIAAEPFSRAAMRLSKMSLVGLVRRP